MLENNITGMRIKRISNERLRIFHLKMQGVTFYPQARMCVAQPSFKCSPGPANVYQDFDTHFCPEVFPGYHYHMYHSLTSTPQVKTFRPKGTEITLNLQSEHWSLNNNSLPLGHVIWSFLDLRSLINRMQCYVCVCTIRALTCKTWPCNSCPIVSVCALC